MIYYFLPDNQTELEKPIAFCRIEKGSLIWRKFLAAPIGKQIIVLDENAKQYHFDDFQKMVARVCTLKESDVKRMEDIIKLQNEIASDKWMMFFAE